MPGENMKAIILQQAAGKPGQVRIERDSPQLPLKLVSQVYHPVPLSEVPVPTPGPGQVLVKIIAAAYNHRDIFIRQSDYSPFRSSFQTKYST